MLIQFLYAFRIKFIKIKIEFMDNYTKYLVSYFKYLQTIFLWKMYTVKYYHIIHAKTKMLRIIIFAPKRSTLNLLLLTMIR